MACDKVSLDIVWLKDESRADGPRAPEVIAQQIVEDQVAALGQFRLIAADLNGGTADAALEQDR